MQRRLFFAKCFGAVAAAFVPAVVKAGPGSYADPWGTTIPASFNCDGAGGRVELSDADKARLRESIRSKYLAFVKGSVPFSINATYGAVYPLA